MTIYSKDLNKYESKRIDIAIRSKIDVYKVWLNSILIMFNRQTLPLENEPVKLSIIKSNMSRIVISSSNRSFSLHFPFKINAEKGTDGLDQFTFRTKGDDLLYPELLHRLLKYIESEKGIFNIENLGDPIDFLEVLDEDIEIFKVFSHLINEESGYLRYDNDPENENGKFHPKFHIDINYRNYATFKIGLNKNLTFDDIIDLMDLDTECWFAAK